MEILELNLKHFGKFTDYKLPLHAGINVISGGNETGKTTLHAFVRAMFYGLNRNRSRNLDEYQLRQPWENPAYFAGSMKILYDGKIYRIDRNFYRKDESVTVVCETDGLAIEDAAAALRTFTASLSESDFDNTIFIRQAQPQTTAQLGEHIRDFLVNLEENGTPSTDVSAAQDLLKKKRRKIEAEKNEQLRVIDSAIRNNQQETEYLNRDLQRLLEYSTADADAGIQTASFQRMDTTVSVRETPVQEESPGRDQDEEDRVRGVAAEPVPETETASPRGMQEEADDEIEEEEEPGGLILPVLVMLSIVAAGLAIACAFITTDHRMRYVLGAGGGLFIIIALTLLWKITHPKTRTQKALERARRGEFLDRTLGFRDDPDDPGTREAKMRRERQLREQVDRARRLDREEEERREKNRRILLEKTLREQEEEDRQNRAREVAELAREQQKAQEQQNAREQQKAQEQQREGRSDVMKGEIRTRREKIAALQEELESLYARKAALSSYDRDLEAIDLASSRIRELSGRIYHESGDEFLNSVSTLLAGLTEGRYNSISLDERMQVKINTPDRLLSIDQVSCGTMHQIYFALRLAAAQLLSGGADLPLLLDETFAMYDEERLESAMRFLSSSSRQVILFSCQKRELEMLAKIRAGSS